MWRLPNQVLVHFELECSTTFKGTYFYYAANTAFQTACVGVILSLRRNRPRLSCPLWIRRSSSIPAITIAAVVHHLKPSIGPMRSFYATVILFDQAVQIFRRPNLCVCWQLTAGLHLTHGAMRRRVSVQCDGSWGRSPRLLMASRKNALAAPTTRALSAQARKSTV